MAKIRHIDVTPEKTRQEKIKEAIEKLPGYRGTVNSKNNIRQLPNVKVGEIFWVEMDNKPFIVSERKGSKITVKQLDENATVSTGITIYDMNKSIVSGEPLFDFNKISELHNQMVNWFFDDRVNDRYFLLYSRDLHYLTLFDFESKAFKPESFKAILDSIQAVGDLISMDFNVGEEGDIGVEIWVRTENSPAELMYLFPYDKGLVVL